MNGPLPAELKFRENSRFFPALPCIDYTDEINLQNLDVEGYMLHFEPSPYEQPFGLCKLSCIIFMKIWYSTNIHIQILQTDLYTFS